MGKRKDTKLSKSAQLEDLEVKTAEAQQKPVESPSESKLEFTKKQNELLKIQEDIAKKISDHNFKAFKDQENSLKLQDKILQTSLKQAKTDEEKAQITLKLREIKKEEEKAFENNLQARKQEIKDLLTVKETREKIASTFTGAKETTQSVLGTGKVGTAVGAAVGGAAVIGGAVASAMSTAMKGLASTLGSEFSSIGGIVTGVIKQQLTQAIGMTSDFTNQLAQQGYSLGSGIQEATTKAFGAYDKAIKKTAFDTGLTINEVRKFQTTLTTVRAPELIDRGTLEHTVSRVQQLSQIYGLSAQEVDKLNASSRHWLGPMNDIAGKLGQIAGLGSKVAMLNIGLGAKEAITQFDNLATSLRAVRVSGEVTAAIFRTMTVGLKDSGLFQRLGFTEKDIGAFGQAATQVGPRGWEAHLSQQFGAGQGMGPMAAYYKSIYGADMVKGKYTIGEPDTGERLQSRFTGIEKYTADITKRIEGAKTEGEKRELEATKLTMVIEMLKKMGITDEKTAIALWGSKDKLGAGSAEFGKEWLKATETDKAKLDKVAQNTLAADQHLAGIKETLLLLAGSLMGAVISGISNLAAQVMKIGTGPGSVERKRAEVAAEGFKKSTENLGGELVTFGRKLETVYNIAGKSGQQVGFLGDVQTVMKTWGGSTDKAASKEGDALGLLYLSLIKEKEALRIQTETETGSIDSDKNKKYLERIQEINTMTSQLETSGVAGSKSYMAKHEARLKRDAEAMGNEMGEITSKAFQEALKKYQKTLEKSSGS